MHARLHVTDPAVISALFGVSEFALLLTRRAGGSTRAADAGSLRTIWIVILISLIAAIAVSIVVPQTGSALLGRLRTAGALLFLAGLFLRAHAIVYLGRFFTVNVALAADHRVIDTGPYRYVRHPSYSAVMLEFLGLGITIGNWLSLPVLLVPVWMVFERRMAIEERALSEALGSNYTGYMGRTKRLIPGVY
jgi:protein-S-isoprenylcysteine O-methyltransferase Ste14